MNEVVTIVAEIVGITPEDVQKPYGSRNVMAREIIAGLMAEHSYPNVEIRETLQVRTESLVRYYLSRCEERIGFDPHFARKWRRCRELTQTALLSMA